MAFFEQMKEKFFAVVGWICEKLRHGRDILKVSGEKNRITGEIRRQYESLGRTIYESKGEDMSACREICDRIDALNDRLEELTARDAVLRSKVRCPRCGTAMERTARFCSACGAAIPGIAAEKPAETTEE